MSCNRLEYDSCAYAKSVQQSTSPLEYQLFRGKFENCKQCTIGDYTNNLDFGVKTDVENELTNRERLTSLCPTKKFNPNKKVNVPKYTTPLICESIHYITPNNLKKPTGPGFDASTLGLNCCAKK